MITIMLAVRHEITRIGMRLLLEQDEQIRVMCECPTGAEVMEQVAFGARPNVVVLEAPFDDLDAIEMMTKLKEGGVNAPVVIYSTLGDASKARELLMAGAHGYVVRGESNLLLTAVRSVNSGAYWIDGSVKDALLGTVNKHHRAAVPVGRVANEDNDGLLDRVKHLLTVREQQVLKLVCEGDTNREIATKLNIGAETVKTHIRKLMEKLGARDRTQIAVIAVRSSA